ncbi:transposase [Pandoraea horticolens]|uniref:Transposase n=1 Tax=Pandoraea horticolens TaxID=2508298 RepID=A0A5E4VGL6_9BURK|nr:transposase [Pandoraea horticolens]
MTPTIMGVDIAKNVMQVHWVDPETGEIVNRPIKRAAFLEYFANRKPCLIGMESCGGSQHWARRLIEMSHQVKLMPAKFVKAFNIRNKNDAADARAIWMATQVASKEVAVKTEAQQAVLALHRMEDHEIGDQMVILNDLQLIVAHVLRDDVGTEIRPLCKLIEAFAFVLRRLHDATQVFVADVFEQKYRVHHPTQFLECKVEPVFPACCT